MSKINKLLNQGKEDIKSKVSTWKALVVATVFSIFWATTDAEAQQVVKNVKGNTVKHFAAANGNTLQSTIGSNNIDIGNSDNRGNVSVYDPSLNIVPKNETVATSTTLPDEIIGNTTFKRDTATQSKTVNTLPTASIQLSFPTTRARGNGDTDAGIEGIITIRERPTLQTNGQPIPINTKIRLSSPALTDLTTWSTLLPLQNQRYNWNGSERVEMTHSPGWVLLPVLEDRGQFMWVEDFNTLWEAVIYPNPSAGPLTIKTDNNLNDKKIEIYNLSGQIVLRLPISGDTSEIDISQLSAGPYILTTEDNDGNKTVNKIIKK